MALNVIKQILVLCLVVVMTSACAGMKRKKGGGGGGPPPDGGGPSPSVGSNRPPPAQQVEDNREIERLTELNQRLQEELDRRNNNVFDNSGFNNALAINGNGVDPNRDVAPGVSGLPGIDPILSGNAFESGQLADGNPLDPNAQPKVLEAGVDPFFKRGQPSAGQFA